jgi:hypothetical protein
MPKLKRAAFTTFVVIGLLAGSGVAAAADDEADEILEVGQVVDTLFSFGYDLINRMFVFNLSALDGSLDCPLVEGTPGVESSDTECGTSGLEVSGPNGQVNHGMFVKLFNSLWQGPGRGCVVRHLAQSELGKGDQQVKPGDTSDTDSEEPGVIDLTTVETHCLNPNKSTLEDITGKPESAGKPDTAGKHDSAGKPDHTDGPGNSSSAPGHNK